MDLLQREILDVLRSGKFTLAFHSEGVCSLYRGRVSDYDALPVGEEVITLDSNTVGYTPEVVYYLAQALKGKTLSI